MYAQGWVAIVVIVFGTTIRKFVEEIIIEEETSNADGFGRCIKDELRSH